MLRLIAPLVLSLMAGIVDADRAYAAETSITSIPWPASGHCARCATFQYGPLEVRLPVDAVKILVPGDSLGGVLLLAKDGDLSATITIHTIEREQMIGLFEKSPRLQLAPGLSNRAFLDQLGAVPPRGDPFEIIRKVLKIDTAKRFLKASQGNLHVYAVQSKPPISDIVYVVVDGDDAIYAMDGPVNAALFLDILSSLRVSPIP